MSTFSYFLIFGFILFLFIFIKRKFKTPVVGSLALVDGAVKSGKTTFALFLAYRNYKRSVLKWRVRCLCLRVFKFCKKTNLPERPLFYSNAPVGFPFVEITEDLILRRSRPRYGSTFFIQEASLLADNSMFKDIERSEQIMLFNKLFGHETCGGLLIYDTQSIGDLPVVTRRCLGQTFYVHHLIKWVPFFLFAFVKEQRYCEDGSTFRIDVGDVDDDGYKLVILPKSVWRKFDCYCYSTFTDNKPVEDTVIKLPKKSSLKASKIISFRKWKL